jgi:hypothetical protein
MNSRKPARVLRFTDENLRGALPPPRKSRDQCSVCRAIGGRVSKLEKGGEVTGDLPAAVGSLREFMRLGENVATNWLEICAECATLYYAERSYEFLIGGSEDYESHAVITHDEVLELAEVSWARQPGAELHAFEDGTWSIIVEPAKNRPQRRS